MKRCFSVIVLCLGLFFSAAAQEQISGREFTMEMEDTTYVMKKYFLCFYVKGPNQNQTATEVMDLQVAHLDHIQKMAKAGKVVISGPLEVSKTDRMRGVLIFDTETQEEAESWVCQDPMVRISRLEYEIYPWWAAKGSILP